MKYGSFCALFACLAIVSVGRIAHAQQSFGGDSTAGSGVAGGAAGGAAMADFDTLMNLIQQTVDPDSWLANGGGNSMLPYPAGVYVDPNGRLSRVEDVQFPERSDASEPRHPWRQASTMRVVSLKAIDRAIAQAVQTGLKPSAELMNLAGLSKVSMVRIDLDHEDILLAGPADGAAHGLQLEDLAVLAALIKTNTTPLGCSIDPEDDGIRAAQALLQEPGTLKRLARSPNMVVEQLEAAIGPHRVTVFGLPAQTGTALALVDADEHMKKVGFAKQRVRGGIDTYFDHVDAQASVPAESLVRWWFAYSDDPVLVSQGGDTFQLPKNCVQVMSEKQWMTATGRQASPGNDAAADAFAADFSKRIPKLRKQYPSYARLAAVFETALALQLAVDASGQSSLESWLPALCKVGQVRESKLVEPKSVDGLATSHRLKSGTVLAVISGGVQIDPKRSAAKLQPSKFLAESIVPSKPAQPATTHGKWWW
ncbi:MAG: DUF1598 domain-containing protein [Aureliella sp.]